MRGCTSLKVLEFGSTDEEFAFSPEFARDVVLPVVCANTSLRILEGCFPNGGGGAMEEVEDILAARRRADEEAV